jgi:hypothetical protein
MTPRSRKEDNKELTTKQYQPTPKRPVQVIIGEGG